MIYTLPFPPSSNHLYLTRGKRRVLSGQGEAYHTAVRVAVMIAHGGKPRPIQGPVAVTCRFFPPEGIRPWDLRNRYKALDDALTQAGVWQDDSQIVEDQDFKMPADGRPRVEVEVRELDLVPALVRG